jgi:hypothetical protein
MSDSIVQRELIRGIQTLKFRIRYTVREFNGCGPIIPSLVARDEKRMAPPRSYAFSPLTIVTAVHTKKLQIGNHESAIFCKFLKKEELDNA